MGGWGDGGHQVQKQSMPLWKKKTWVRISESARNPGKLYFCCEKCECRFYQFWNPEPDECNMDTYNFQDEIVGNIDEIIHKMDEIDELVGSLKQWGVAGKGIWVLLMLILFCEVLELMKV